MALGGARTRSLADDYIIAENWKCKVEKRDEVKVLEEFAAFASSV